MTKRFIEFATQNTDNGEINNGFQDIKTGEWYYTKNSENAKKICDLLNTLHEENQSLKFDNKELIRFITSNGYTLQDYIKFIGQFQSVGVNKEDWE